MKIRMEPIDQANHPRLAEALGASTATLGWLAAHPAGPGVAITAWRGDSPAGGVIAIPGQVSQGGTLTPLTRLVMARVDHPDAAPALRDRLALELGDRAVLSLESALTEPLTQKLDATPLAPPAIWATGPDPFVPTQPDVHALDASFDELAKALAGAALRRVHRTAETWRWRYQSHPERTYRLMHVRRGGRVLGFIAARIATINGKKTIVVLELSALNDDVTYLLLKSVRRWSWEERSLPVLLVDTGLQRWFAFTAGYVAMPAAASRRRRSAVACGIGTDWTLHEADWLRL